MLFPDVLALRGTGRWFSKAIWLVEESGKVTGAEASDVSQVQLRHEFGQERRL